MSTAGTQTKKPRGRPTVTISHGDVVGQGVLGENPNQESSLECVQIRMELLGRVLSEILYPSTVDEQQTSLAQNTLTEVAL